MKTQKTHKTNTTKKKEQQHKPIILRIETTKTTK